MKVSWIEKRKRESKPRFKIGDKVRYKGRKYKVTFIHTVESLLAICYMYDLRGKNGRLCCVIDMNNITLVKKVKPQKCIV